MEFPGDGARAIDEAAAMRAMFVARKEVFVDLLGWDVPVLDGRFELDHFDDSHARYLILLDEEGRHRASARLLPTTRPHILDSLFPELCQGELPRGPHVVEITRFCLDRHQNARERREARNRLVSALADFALAERIATYTGVAEIGWTQQILEFGWDCRLLGLPHRCGSSHLAALGITIDAHTIDRLTANGIYDPAHARPARTFTLSEAA